MDMEEDIEGDPDQDRREYADLLPEMAPSASPYVSIGRRSFNNSNSHADRYRRRTHTNTPPHRNLNALFLSNNLINPFWHSLNVYYLALAAPSIHKRPPGAILHRLIFLNFDG